jgi:hypothetical protein
VSKQIYDFSDVKYRIENRESVNSIADSKGCSISSIYTFLRKNKIQIPELNLIDTKFGKFTVKSRIGSSGDCGKQAIYWKCECECGETRNYSTAAINSKKFKSCGCFLKSKERKRASKNWKGYQDIQGKLWYIIQKGAIDRKLEFTIKIEEVWDLYIKQDRKCALSKLPIIFPASLREYGTASLDRIDSSKGYITGNVQWVHKDINQIKWNLDELYFVQLCKLVSENYTIGN